MDSNCGVQPSIIDFKSQILLCNTNAPTASPTEPFILIKKYPFIQDYNHRAIQGTPQSSHWPAFIFYTTWKLQPSTKLAVKVTKIYSLDSNQLVVTSHMLLYQNYMYLNAVAIVPAVVNFNQVWGGDKNCLVRKPRVLPPLKMSRRVLEKRGCTNNGLGGDSNLMWNYL